MVAYENQTTRSLFREEVPIYLLFGLEFIACDFLLVTYTFRSAMLSLKILRILCREWCGTYSEYWDHTMSQVFPYKRNGKTIKPSDGGLREVLQIIGR